MKREINSTLWKVLLTTRLMVVSWTALICTSSMGAKIKSQIQPKVGTCALNGKMVQHVGNAEQISKKATLWKFPSRRSPITFLMLLLLFGGSRLCSSCVNTGYLTINVFWGVGSFQQHCTIFTQSLGYPSPTPPFYWDINYAHQPEI
jgi:hypothetical protein